MQLSADVFGQRVTLDEHNATLTQILRKIEKQSGYTFFYNRKEVRDLAPINLSVNDESVANTLEKLFKNQPYGFEIQEKIIVLNKKAIPYVPVRAPAVAPERSEEHTSELQSLMRISYAVFCLKKKTKTKV